MSGTQRIAERERTDGVRLVFVLLAIMWATELLDLVFGNALDGFGIRPRDAEGLVGVLFAPFLHVGFAHLLGNTVPFAVLGVIIAFSGVLRLLTVSAITALASGVGAWLLSPSFSVTIGASGVVFGYAAYLLARGVIVRSVPSMVAGMVVLVLFGGGLLISLIPQAGVSWQGHLFGALGGVLAARLLDRPPVRATRPRPLA
jgi:membrane associated rhomboid family serine protease